MQVRVVLQTIRLAANKVAMRAFNGNPATAGARNVDAVAVRRKLFVSQLVTQARIHLAGFFLGEIGSK
jgi:hypothetical protein